MQTIGGLLGFPYFGALLWLGFRHDPFWIPLLFPVGGVLLNFMVKPGMVIHFQRYPVSFVAQLYALQTVLAYLTFGVGWAVGAVAA